MGDPRTIRKKYSGPGHPWKKARLDEERALVKEYGLVNKKEIYKANSKTKGFANQAKKLIALTTEQSKRETKQLLDRLARLGLLAHGAKLDDVLELKTRNILDRRLQTVLAKRALARTSRQARQFITHNHIMVGDKVISAPGYIVPVSEEANITFRTTSTLSSSEHPERTAVPKKPEKKKPEGFREKKRPSNRRQEQRNKRNR